MEWNSGDSLHPTESIINNLLTPYSKSKAAHESEIQFVKLASVFFHCVFKIFKRGKLEALIMNSFYANLRQKHNCWCAQCWRNIKAKINTMYASKTIARHILMIVVNHKSNALLNVESSNSQELFFTFNLIFPFWNFSLDESDLPPWYVAMEQNGGRNESNKIKPVPGCLLACVPVQLSSIPQGKQ
jgi:hypothetical protein